MFFKVGCASQVDDADELRHQRLAPPRNLAVEPIKRAYGEGDTLHGKADAYPPAKFRWALSSTQRVISETSTLLVTADMANDWILELQAYNDYRNSTHSASMKVLITRKTSVIEVLKWVSLAASVLVIAGTIHYVRNRPVITVPGPPPPGGSTTFMSALVRAGLMEPQDVPPTGQTTCRHTARLAGEHVQRTLEARGTREFWELSPRAAACNDHALQADTRITPITRNQSPVGLLT
ncbi:hypothetical protein LSAT2_014756 [Lamellibrachia satsuma]|nr:hypothetical protein LSAT2_014756 [Lamellibrachia satsuma]